jgi:hypothetical protein
MEGNRLWFLFLFEISRNNERLCVCAALYREVGEASKETEHSEAISKKVKDLKRRIEEAEAASSHHQLLQVTLLSTIDPYHDYYCQIVAQE